MNPNTFIKMEHKTFSLIESNNGSVKCWVGRPDKNALLALTFSFNVKNYELLMRNLSKIKFLEIKEIGEHGSNMSYVVIKLIERNTLSSLLEIIPILLDDYYA